MNIVESCHYKQFITDEPHKQIEVHRFAALPGVEFWSLHESTGAWAMQHDTYSAAVQLGPVGHCAWHSRASARVARVRSVLLMEPGEVHVTRRPSQPISSFMVCWRPNTLRQAAIDRGSTVGLRFQRPQLEDPALAEMLQQLQAAVRSRDLARVLALHELTVDHLLDAVGTPSQELEPRRNHPGTRRAISYLHELYAESISLELLAKQARLSKYYFARSFQEMTGLSPHRYQTILRLQSARRILEAGASVEVAAGRVGFSDAPHLTRVFGAWLGVSPGAWARGQTRPSSSPPRPMHGLEHESFKVLAAEGRSARL